ncbi:MAG: MarR family transcriptional regulator [Gammaproteobacteria bacterium]|mgnify:CR=1 FL=1|nr:MAG: MarR family transcriptional regulator [Gammaproteobacteria bacterium]
MVDSKKENNFDSVLVALRRIIRATDIDSKNISRMVGLTTPQLMVMQTIRELGDVPIKSIASEVNLTQATVTTILDRLENNGMISRERGTADRRKVFITITEKGFALLREAPKTLQDQFQSQFQDLHDWEQTMIVAALERVAHMMDAQHIDASPVLDIGAIDRNHE